MTTSGATSFDLKLNELVEEAFERCGVEMRSGYDLRTARRSLNLLTIEWANRGLNLWTVEEGTIPLTAGTALYSLPTDTIAILDHVVRTGTGNNQSDLTITRISGSDYSSIPSKNSQGRPVQIWFDRQGGQTDPTDGVRYPVVTLWPVPDNSQPYTLVLWRLRRMQDAGNGTTTQDIPFRFLPALVAGLAYHLSMKLPGALERSPVLKMQYEELWQQAADEDREKADLRIVPRVGRI
jgi:hypothetical protein